MQTTESPLFISTAEAGRQLGVSKTIVNRMLDRGHLKGLRISQRQWLVRADSIPSLLERKKRGRPSYKDALQQIAEILREALKD